MYLLSYTQFTQSKKYLDSNLDRDSEDVSVYKGHLLFNTSASHCCSLFSHCYIAIHLISGLKLSRSGSRSSVYMVQNFLIQIAI